MNDQRDWKARERCPEAASKRIWKTVQVLIGMLLMELQDEKMEIGEKRRKKF